MAESILKIHTQNGDIPVGYPGLADKPVADKTLTIDGAFADAKTVGDKFTEAEETVSQLKEDIGNLNDKKITKFYASNLGETHLSDSDNGKIMDMMLYGRSEQKQYKGINLLPTGITFGDIIEVSIPKGTRAFWATDGTPALGGNFKFYNEDKTQVAWFGVDAGKTAMKSTINIDTKYIEFLISETQSVKICLGIGDNPVYEPYTGGQPSPSPDYPQEIKSVVNPTIKLLGSNILKMTDCEYQHGGVTITVSNGTVKVKGISNDSFDFNLSANPYMFKEGTEIIFSPNNVKGTEQSICYLDFTNSATKGFSIANNNINSPYIIKKDDSEHPFLLHGRVAGGVTYDEIWKPQILIGKTITPFKPYTEQTITLPITLNAIPVSSGGNVAIDGQQYIADYVDVERGKLVRRVDNVIFQGTQNEVWSLWNENYDNLWSFMYQFGVKAFANESASRCNRFKFESTETIDTSYWLCNPSNNPSIQIKYRTVGKDVAAFKAWLSKNPVVVQYILAIPTETDLTPEEIAAFKALATYYPVTNISANSEQLDGYTVFNYPISMENGWNYVKQQLNDNRDYIYDMDTKTQDIDTQSAEAYVNSEYAVALTELEV